MYKVKFIGGPLDGHIMEFSTVFEFHYFQAQMFEGKVHAYQTNIFGTEVHYVGTKDSGEEIIWD